MYAYLIRRTLQSLVVVWLASVLIFVGMRLTADPVHLLLPETATQAEEDALRERLGLNLPLPVQYARFFTGIIQGDFGISWIHHRPAMQLVIERLPASMQLAGLALTLSLLLAIPLGILAATLRSRSRGRWLEKLTLIISLVGVSVPSFWLAILALLIFSVQFQLLPTSGRGTVAHYIMPVTILALYNLAVVLRLTRTGMIEILAQDFIRTARAKGLPERLVLYRHALKNVLIPVITVTGVNFGNTLVYATVVETIFAWPGIGRLLLTSMMNLDYPVLVAYGIVVAVIFTLVNLIVDLGYAFLDPRIRHG